MHDFDIHLERQFTRNAFFAIVKSVFSYAMVDLGRDKQQVIEEEAPAGKEAWCRLWRAEFVDGFFPSSR